MQVQRSRTLYDVCIVGSGAGGGMAAKVLTESGANVVMLEAGPMWNPSSESYMHKWAYDSPRRGAATEKQQFGEFDAAFGGWTLEGEPYTNGTGSQFDWFRSRMLGGRTNHWGRISLRFGPDDFRRKSLDGLGDDWPITYDDMKPFYDRVDSAARRACRTILTVCFCRRPSRAASSCSSSRPPTSSRSRASPADCRSSRNRSMGAWRVTTAGNAAAAARSTRTSRRHPY
jgi:choline dehydrogenase-like flavoprotein